MSEGVGQHGPDHSGRITSVAARMVMVMTVVALALLGAWRWQLGPRLAAAREAEAPELVALREAAIEELARFDVATKLDDPRAAAADLRWRAPGECVEVYRIRVDEHYRDPSVAAFVGRPEEHSTAYLAVAAAATRRPGSSSELAAVDGLLFTPPAHDNEDEDEDEDEPSTRARELWWSSREVGPRAPDFTCRRRSWDRLEDALALAWPRLPAAATRVGERWIGSAVGGRCHETVCLEPDGSFGHALPCRARPWAEQLAGADGDLLLIRGRWDDGHDPERPEIGILTSRELLIDEGRPLFARVTIEHRWAGVRRELVLARVDDCGARRLAFDGEDRQLAATRERFREQFRARLSRPAVEG